MTPRNYSYVEHSVEFSFEDFILLDRYPKPNWQSTFTEIANTRPINAYNLFIEFLQWNSAGTNPIIKTELEHALITTDEDGPEAAKGALINCLKNNIAGGTIAIPTQIEVLRFTSSWSRPSLQGADDFRASHDQQSIPQRNLDLQCIIWVS